MLRKWFRSDYSVAKELKTKLVTAKIDTFVAIKLFTIFCNVIHKRGDHRKKLNIFLKRLCFSLDNSDQHLRNMSENKNNFLFRL